MKNKLYKAEIHVHLEAALPPSLCKKFAKRNNYEIAEEMFRRSTMQWSYHDLHDIMGDGKRLPKAQKIYRQHYDFVRACLKRHYINQEVKND